MSPMLMQQFQQLRLALRKKRADAALHHAAHTLKGGSIADVMSWAKLHNMHETILKMVSGNKRGVEDVDAFTPLCIGVHYKHSEGHELLLVISPIALLAMAIHLDDTRSITGGVYFMANSTHGPIGGFVDYTHHYFPGFAAFASSDAGDY